MSTSSLSSTFTNSKYYPEYKKYLAEFSICIKPVLEATYERMAQKLPEVGESIDNYCLAERNKVEQYRNLIKNEFTH